jgi:hypothetical protein
MYRFPANSTLQLCQKYLVKKMPKFIGLTIDALQREIKKFDDEEDGSSENEDETDDTGTCGRPY